MSTKIKINPTDIKLYTYTLMLGKTTITADDGVNIQVKIIASRDDDHPSRADIWLQGLSDNLTDSLKAGSCSTSPSMIQLNMGKQTTLSQNIVNNLPIIFRAPIQYITTAGGIVELSCYFDNTNFMYILDKPKSFPEGSSLQSLIRLAKGKLKNRTIIVPPELQISMNSTLTDSILVKGNVLAALKNNSISFYTDTQGDIHITKVGSFIQIDALTPPNVNIDEQTINDAHTDPKFVDEHLVLELDLDAMYQINATVFIMYDKPINHKNILGFYKIIKVEHKGSIDHMTKNTLHSTGTTSTIWLTKIS